MKSEQFTSLLRTIADGWNTKNAGKAVECFTDDAIAIEPPDKQLFQGRDQLFAYFGGKDGFDMQLIWRNICFNEETQTGSGEYTFTFNNIIHHGVAILETDGSKITLWREYDVPTTLSREDFLKITGKQYKFTIKELLAK